MPPIDSGLPFTEAERHVFEFFDGTKTRFADPLAIERRYFRNLAETGEDVEQLREQLKSPTPVVVIDACDRFRAATRAAFGLPDFVEADGTGFTDEQVDLLNDRYQTWLNAVKPPTGSTPSASPSSADPAAPDPATSTPAPAPGATPAPTPAGPGGGDDSAPGDPATSNTSAAI